MYYYYYYYYYYLLEHSSTGKLCIKIEGLSFTFVNF
jgi:hypothetical protein